MGNDTKNELGKLFRESMPPEYNERLEERIREFQERDILLHMKQQQHHMEPIIPRFNQKGEVLKDVPGPMPFPKDFGEELKNIFPPLKPAMPLPMPPIPSRQMPPAPDFNNHFVPIPNKPLSLLPEDNFPAPLPPSAPVMPAAKKHSR